LAGSAVHGLEWRATAIEDPLRLSITSPTATRPPPGLSKDEIEDKASKLPEHLLMYRVDSIDGARGIVMRRNCIVFYAENPDTAAILRVVHEARQ